MRVAITAPPKHRVQITKIKILKTLLSNIAKAPRDIAMEADLVPGTVKNLLTRLKHEDVVQRIGYAKYIITDFGREYFKIISQPSTDQSSGESRK